MHMMESDEWARDYDIPAARAIVASVEGAELFLYPGDGHLIADSSAPDYDEEAALLLKKRVLEFLDRSR
jgi:dienelactone hydrolase